MIDTIEVKDSVQDTVNGFGSVMNNFNDIKETMTVYKMNCFYKINGKAT